jgi:hypothetical protein
MAACVADRPGGEDSVAAGEGSETEEENSSVMKEPNLNSARFSGAIVLILRLVYIRWKSLQFGVRNPEEGGMQTILRAANVRRRLAEMPR